MVVCDAVMRKLPGRARPRGERGRGVVQPGARGRAEYPHYTRPSTGGARRSGGAAVGRPRPHPRVAPRAEPRRAAQDVRPRRLRYHCPSTRDGRPSVASFCAHVRSHRQHRARSAAPRPRLPGGRPVRVHFQVVEGTRRRTQVFEGIVIKRQGSGVRETFTVRKQSFGVGVERTFPLHSPKIERIEVAARGDVRRAKLYYLRDRVGRAPASASAAGRVRGGHRAGPSRGGRDAGGRRPAPRRGGARPSRWPQRRRPRRAPRGARRLRPRRRRPTAESDAPRPTDAEGDEPRREPASRPATSRRLGGAGGHDGPGGDAVKEKTGGTR